MTHRVAEIAFGPGTEVGTMVCTCRWTGSTADFPTHRGKLAHGHSRTLLGPAASVSLFRRYPRKVPT